MPTSQIQQGDFIQADFFDNVGGLNVSDSPFKVNDTQATGGYNYNYIATGGIRKSNGTTKANASADAQLRSFGFGLYNSITGTKAIVRAAGTKLQTVDSTTFVCTNQTDDTTAAGSTFFNSASTKQAVMSQFNTPSSSALWVTGAGSSAIYGYTGTKVTKNGAETPTGSISTSVGGSGGSFVGTGTFYYGVALHKASTGAISNVVLDKSATISNTTDKVTITLSSITGIDTTKYDKIYIYRSALGGVSGFTTGDLIAQANSTDSSYVDDGTYLATAQNVPRLGNIVLDNGVLPSGTYNVLTTFKRRLVTAKDSTVYLSDLNKPESWPAGNTIDIPSGGPITGLAVISFSTPTTSATNEFLCIFKERELWIITGSSLSDWSLLFIDNTGALSQTSIVSANGFLYWLDYRGVYLWDGSGKPIYCSRPIEQIFGADGDLDDSKLDLSVGVFFRKQNEVIWFLSNTNLGEQVYQLRLDLRLTLPAVQGSLGGRVLDGVFIQGSTATAAMPIYAAAAINPTYNEILISGDASGNIFTMFDNDTGDNGTGVEFSYTTKTLDFGRITQTKRYHKVVVWCRDTTLANLTLNYWVTYKTDNSSMASITQPVTTAVTQSIWDLATWDSFYWDALLTTYTPVVFNLNSPQAGTEGEALTLQFVQTDANAPLTIAGFSVFYSMAGLRK